MSQSDGTRILVIDGEQILQIGVTPAFVMLKEVMGRISFDQNKHENEILPCDYFDLIVGSGDGGWLALMLGRLRMSVSRALDSYESIRAAVHGGEATSASIDETVMSTIEAITAKTDKFRIQILDLIASESDTPQSEKELLFDPTKPRPRCLTAVITQSAGHIAHPIILRTYKHRDNPTPNCPLWIAIRACTAVPNAFTPITIEDMSLVSASHLGHNNPITWALQEAKVQFPDAELSCVASLGSGHPGPFSLQPSDTSAPMNAAMHLARDSEEKAHEIAQLFHDQGRSGVYFRLSVEQGLQHYYYNQGFEKCEAKLHTRQYLLQPDINQRVNTLARLLKSSQHYGRDYSAGFIPDQSSQRGLSSTNKSPVLLAGPSVGSLPPLSWPSPSFPSCAPFPPSPRPSIFPWFWPARQYPNTFKFEPVDTKSFWSYGGHENVRDLSKPAMKAKGTTTAPPQPGAGPASPSLAPISQEAGTKSHDTKLPKNKPPGSTFWGKSESYQKEFIETHSLPRAQSIDERRLSPPPVSQASVSAASCSKSKEPQSHSSVQSPMPSRNKSSKQEKQSFKTISNENWATRLGNLCHSLTKTLTCELKEMEPLDPDRAWNCKSFIDRIEYGQGVGKTARDAKQIAAKVAYEELSRACT